MIALTIIAATETQTCATPHHAPDTPTFSCLPYQSQDAYQELISSVDKLDRMATIGMKEKDGLKDDKEILQEYGTPYKKVHGTHKV